MDAGVFYLFFPEGEGFMRGEERSFGDGGGADGAALGDGDGVFELLEGHGGRSFSNYCIQYKEFGGKCKAFRGGRIHCTENGKGDAVWIRNRLWSRKGPFGSG